MKDHKSKVKLGKKIKETSGKRHAYFEAETPEKEMIIVRKPISPLTP